MRSLAGGLMLVSAVAAADDRSTVADRVMKLTRDSPWKMVASLPIAFTTYHPQGMVKIGDTLFVSSVDSRAGIASIRRR